MPQISTRSQSLQYDAGIALDHPERSHVIIGQRITAEQTDECNRDPLSGCTIIIGVCHSKQTDEMSATKPL